MTSEMHKSFGKEGNIPKKDVYGWEIHGEKGKFVEINKGDLKVDLRYQRDVSTIRRNQIASDFYWEAFGALLVSKRKDGYYVIDGHHRLEAALSRSDIVKLPCMVYEFENVMEEAKVFDIATKQRFNMSTINRFRVRVFYKDPTAIGVEKILESTGHKVETNKNTKSVRCPAVLMKCYDKNSKKLEEYWPFMVRLCEGEIHEDIVKGIFYLVHDMGIDLNGDKNKLLLAGRMKLLRSISDAGMLMGGKSVGEKVSAYGISKIINFRRRDKIEIFPS